VVHRLRRRFQGELQRLVSDPNDVDDEIRDLIRALNA
jgi:hypothetical protein